MLDCPIKGQVFYDGVKTGAPCEATCTNPNPVCVKQCRHGCGCPRGTVLDVVAEACVSVEECTGACTLEDGTVLQNGEEFNRNPCRTW